MVEEEADRKKAQAEEYMRATQERVANTAKVIQMPTNGDPA